MSRDDIETLANTIRAYQEQIAKLEAEKLAVEQEITEAAAFAKDIIERLEAYERVEPPQS